MIDQAIKVAKRSSTGKYMMGCVIADKNNKIVSNGWAHVPEWNQWPLYSLHAELHALARCRNVSLQPAREVTAYIAAVSRKSGNCTMARPCSLCAVALFAAGVSRIVYTIRVSTMPTYPVTQSESLFSAMTYVDSFKVYNSPQF